MDGGELKIENEKRSEENVRRSKSNLGIPNQIWRKRSPIFLLSLPFATLQTT